MVSWFKGENRISSSFYSVLINGLSQLNISSVSHLDAGDYFCFSSNSVGNITSSVAFVTVNCKYCVMVTEVYKCIPKNGRHIDYCNNQFVVMILKYPSTLIM